MGLKDLYSLGALKTKIQQEFNKFQQAFTQHATGAVNRHTADAIDMNPVSAALNESTVQGSIEKIITNLISPEIGDLNSLIDSSVGELSWRLLSPDMAPLSIQRIAGIDNAGNRTAWRINRDLNCPVNGYLERAFVIPPNVSSIEFTTDIQLPSNAVANTVQLQIYDTTGHSQLYSTNITPTETLTEYSTGAISVTSGLEYRARITFASNGQADVLISNVRIEPVNVTTGLFSSNFYRISAENLHDNNESGWAAARYPTQSAYSHITFKTSSDSISIEAYNNLGNYIASPNDSITVLVNGKIYTSINPTVDSMTVTNVALPSGIKTVSVLSGSQVSQDTYTATLRGVHISAVYASNAAYIYENKNPPIIIYGDSKMAGYYSDLPGRDGLVPILRRMGHRVICEAYGGRAFVSDVSTTISIASCNSFARKLTRHSPKMIVIGIGRNDFTGAALTQTNWTNQLGNLCDAIASVSPNTRILLVTFTSESTESNNGNGDTWAGWRNAMETVAFTRTAFVRVCRAHTLWTVAQAVNYTSDTVHPNSRGYALLASAILGDGPLIIGASVERGELWPWSPVGLSNLYAHYELSRELTVTEISPVTSNGTTPPTVTLSGTPNYPFQLDIAIRTAGTLGLAKFAWSIDGGESWIERDKTTSASVVLGNTGITATFSAGTYLNDNTYTAGTIVSQINDVSGNNRHLSQSNNTKRGMSKFGTLNGGKKHIGIKFDGVDDVYYRTMTLTAPFTIIIVANMNQGAIRSLIGGDISQAIYIYSNTSTTMAINDGGTQVAATVNMASAHVITAIFSSAGDIRVDGTGTSSADLNDHSPTTFYLGGDDANSQWYSDGIIHEVIILSNDDPVTIAQCEAMLRHKYGRL